MFDFLVLLFYCDCSETRRHHATQARNIYPGEVALLFQLRVGDEVFLWRKNRAQ